jgi:cytochrome oxidase Cu insertion factor (SCO1/SenC/PrrC family)
MKPLPTFALAAALALSLATAWFLWRAADQLGGGPQGAAATPFVLVDQEGRQRSDKDFRGRWVLLYFGYSYCPDVCPTTLAVMANTLDRLGPQADRVVPVFVSVDPARDTPAVLKAYLAAFGPRFVGLTGKPEAIARLAHAYGVYYRNRPLPGGTYSVDHSSAIYLLDPEGRFVKTYDDQDGPAAIAADLKKRL